MTRTPWTRIGCLDEIPRPGVHVVRRAGQPDVAIFRTATDRVFALLDRCPHRGIPLSKDMLHAERVTCLLHNTIVDLESGSTVAPQYGCVKTFAVRVEDGAVYFNLCEHADGAGQRAAVATRR